MDHEFVYVDMAVLAENIQALLKQKLDAEFVEVKDDSARHQMVYALLDSLMESGIHAFSMRTLTPDEWKKLQGEEGK